MRRFFRKRHGDEKEEVRQVLTLESNISGIGACQTHTHDSETKAFTKLGPYEAKNTVFNSKSFHLLDPELESPNPLFLIHREAFQGEKKGLAKLIVNFPLEGQMSPKHAVTLGPEARRHAQIPNTAKYYVWSYPIDVQWRHYENKLVDALKDCNCLDSPELMFLIMGGYVYFDENYQIVSANALICGTRQREEELTRIGSGLKFGKPEKFPEKFINQLMLYDRLKVVSWPVLNELDNPPTFFAWLRPKEELVAPDRERRLFGAHGGFVFIFHKDKDELRELLTEENCYFPVICNNPQCCTGVLSHENKNPLFLVDTLSLEANRRFSQQSLGDEKKEAEGQEASFNRLKEESLQRSKKKSEKGASFKLPFRISGRKAVTKAVERPHKPDESMVAKLQDLDTPNLDEDEPEEESSGEKKESVANADMMKDILHRNPSEWPTSANAAERIRHCDSHYRSENLMRVISGVELEEEEDEKKGLSMQIPTMKHGTTSLLVQQFESFALNAEELDWRVLGYFIASLPDSVLAKIDLDRVILSKSNYISTMGVNLREVVMKNQDHAKRVEELRALVARDREQNEEELDHSTLDLLEKQFENHLKTGRDDVEGVENKLLFAELVKRFYYYVKPVAQAKAELEARIKEKHWLKLRYRKTLRIIRAKFTEIGHQDAYDAYFSEYCYLAKIVMNFIDPPRKIPYFEDGENTDDFKVDETVIVRPFATGEPRLGVIHRKLPNGDYSVKDMEGLGDLGPEVVKKKRVQRLFMWSCFRCKNSDQDMWRDIYPLKQWVSCTKCGLVTQKTLSKTRYHVRNLIRDSCYGGIYRGYDAVRKRDCAIKKNDLAQVEQKVRKGTNDHVAEDIFTEIKLHFAISPTDTIVTPGILRIYDQYEDETFHYLVLEWADKGELFEHVVQNFQQPNFLRNERAIAKWKQQMQQMFHEICLGVKKIHNEGIVHRDLSLENLLLIENKNYVRGKMPKLRPVICDFGLASVDRRRGFTDSVGKLGYMSPECLAGRYDGKKNDIWCLGIILVMMMIGAPPYSKVNDRAFQYLMGGKKPMKYLFRQYKRDHLIPEIAYEVFCGIFIAQDHRMTIEQILDTKYCRTVQFPDYHNN